jgi:hypothetical protein
MKDKKSECATGFSLVAPDTCQLITQEMDAGITEILGCLYMFIYVLAPHTGEVISDVLHDVLQDWQMEKKVSTVTLDNCITNDNLMCAMKDKLPLPSLMLHGRLLHMCYATHIINLIVKNGMTVMDKGIERVRDSVDFWSATPKRHERFERTTAQMNIKYEKRIALDCKTR